MQSRGAYVKNLVRGAPKPDEIDALVVAPDEKDDGESGQDDNPDEEGKEAAGRSAFNDFMKAIGSKGSDEAYSAFMDAVKYCGG
jgi:hypothetical protein